MAIRDEIKTWVRAEIQASIHEHLNPHGWRKLQQFLPLAGVLAVFVGLLALVGAGWNYAFSRVRQEAEFQTHVTDRLGTIDSSLQALNKTVAQLQLKQLSSNPANPQVTKEVRNVLASAKSGKIQLDTEAITDAGKRFVDAAKTYPEACNAVQEILNYRTYINSVSVPLGQQVVLSKTSTSKYEIPMQNVLTIISLKTIGTSQSPDVPEIRALSAPNPNANLTVGPTFLVLDAPTVVLDGLYAKKMIFENSHIIYRGGPASLINVYFLNCTFEIMKGSTGQELVTAILSPNALTDFSTRSAS
jgi:hypothetical protein